jgi:hypothetical protein
MTGDIPGFIAGPTGKIPTARPTHQGELMTAENRPVDAVPDTTPDLTEPEQDVLDDASTGDVPNAYDGGFDGTESHEPAEPTQRLEETSARDADWADPEAGDASDESQGGRPVADDGHAT